MTTNGTYLILDRPSDHLNWQLSGASRAVPPSGKKDHSHSAVASGECFISWRHKGGPMQNVRGTMQDRRRHRPRHDQGGRAAWVGRATNTRLHLSSNQMDVATMQGHRFRKNPVRVEAFVIRDGMFALRHYCRSAQHVDAAT